AAAELEAHQLAALRVVGCATRDAPLFQLLAIDGIDDTVAAGKGAEDAELAARVAGETFDWPCLIGIVSVGSERCDAGEHPIADAGGRRLILFAFDHEDARGDSMLLRPIGWPRDEVTIGVALDDFEHGDRWQHSGAL